MMQVSLRRWQDYKNSVVNINTLLKVLNSDDDFCVCLFWILQYLLPLESQYYNNNSEYISSMLTKTCKPYLILVVNTFSNS